MPPKRDTVTKAGEKKSEKKGSVSNVKSPAKAATAVVNVPKPDPENFLADILAQARAAQLLAAQETEAAANTTVKIEVPLVQEPKELAESLIKSYFNAIERKIPHGELVNYFSKSAVVGYTYPGHEKIVGANKIAVSLSYMYHGLNLLHIVDEFIHDADPPSRCDAYVTCKSRMMIAADSPRKVIQVIIELKLSSPDEETIATLGMYRVSNHLMVCTDCRPLYEFASILRIPKGRHDNWDPLLAERKAQYFIDHPDSDDDDSVLSKNSPPKDGETGGLEDEDVGEHEDNEGDGEGDEDNVHDDGSVATHEHDPETPIPTSASIDTEPGPSIDADAVPVEPLTDPGANIPPSAVVDVDLPPGSIDLPTVSVDLPTGSVDLPPGSIDLPTGSVDLPPGSIDLPTD